MADSVKENLEMQVSEMEMLFSMFPGEGDIRLEDACALLHVMRYLEGVRESLPPRIEFCIEVKIDNPQVTVDLHASLPHSYPQVAPVLFTRCSSLDRQQQKLLNDNLSSYISALDREELCITLAVQWVQDHSMLFLKNCKLPPEPAGRTQEVNSVFHRMWIYSHHIYRQELRKKILNCAKKLHLTGFCLTGKPGVICVEGAKDDCEEFWHDIRYPNWKHISCKHAETISEVNNIDECRLFPAFEELTFEAHGDYGLRNDYHMDLGQFLEYLKEHKSEHIFQILFGIDGKTDL
ncbi:RWD domain-containing protein 2A [Lepisosteus oculatus]|uniref:RWD domain-containing protein 2A n=1 Tax=Lepisosteus oculatus TaxID=7918 RepID=UPI0035F50114